MRRAAVRATRPAAGLLAIGRMVVAILVYQALLLGTSIALYFVGLQAIPVAAEGTYGLVALGVAEGAALLGVIFVWRTLDGRHVAELGLRRQSAVRRWLIGGAIAALMMGFIVCGWYTVVDGATWDINPDASRAAVVLIGGLLGFVVQGPAEEVLFRGYLFENLKDQWGVAWAVAISSIVFGVFHAPNPAFGILPFVNLVLFGAATALVKVYVDGGQLWAVFGIHTTWNWLQQVVFGLPNSGIASTADNALFTVTPDTSSAAPIWGGGFGPEGTLATTLVLLALLGVCLRRRLRHSRPG